jgi:hypothetical protein
MYHFHVDLKYVKIHVIIDGLIQLYKGVTNVFTMVVTLVILHSIPNGNRVFN